MQESKKYKSIIKKKKKKDKIASLLNSRSNSKDVLISKALIDSSITHDEYPLINSKLKKYDDRKEKIKNLKSLTVNQRFYTVYKTLLSYILKCRKNTESKGPKVKKTENGRIMFSSSCAICSSKKSRFIKNQEASRISSSIALRTSLH